MVYIRYKSISNKNKDKKYIYAYEVINYYDKIKKSPRQKVIRYIGKAHDLNIIVVKKVFERDNFKCCQCNSIENLTIDHIKPLSKKGSNKLDNLQTLCITCNLKKRDL